MNAITITGNLANDPEVRFTNAGTPVASFTVGQNERLGPDRDVFNGFIDVTVFGSAGEYAAEALKKGERVVVTGRINQQSWQDDNGNTRYRVKLIAQEVGLSLAFQGATRPVPAERD